ncbi:MAG TPA: sucrose phosphorylase, partial [Clostridia bacterium]|nr:sucrose phosphorylase [Clostridia bacterium]
MKRNNKIMLITYSDSIGANLKELSAVLNRYYSKAIGGVHILPFYPSSADRGFAPMTYREVDPAFGNWEDVEALARNYYLMFDYMINHISRNSEYFQDFLKRKDASPYQDLFIRYQDFWPGGDATQEDIDRIYKRKPRPPYMEAEFANGTREKVWCTFDEEQIDLNLPSETTKAFNRENLRFLTERGAALIRLDALAYATKKAGTDCFFVEPNIWDILKECDRTLQPLNVELLPEIHEHYRYQMKLSEHGYWVYDFALPMLVLYSLYSGKKNRLEHWLGICPRKQFTTLDTH